jgi:subtilase family serine protease
LSPSQIAGAYGLSAGTNTGAGQTIAIIDAFHDPFLASDLATFDSGSGLPGTTSAQVSSFLTQVNLAGNQTNDGWSGEEALDAEWVHAVAPQAKIVVVEAKSDSLSDLMAAVNTARNLPNVSVVSMSWGGPEFSGETAYDSNFTTPAGHVPITFVAASGDSSAYAGAQWPASSPNVVAVGGTSLYLGTNGQRIFEAGWSGSGGGVSRFEPEPSFQSSVQSIGARTTPDVSIVANPYSGVSTYSTAPSSGQGSWQVVGGTSVSAQIWAGLIGDANQARASAGKTTLSTSETLTALYNSPSSFNDITWGSNGYWAWRGYDLVTGLGTPRVASVISTLVQPGTATGAVAAASSNSSSGAAATTSLGPTPVGPTPVLPVSGGSHTGAPVVTVVSGPFAASSSATTTSPGASIAIAVAQVPSAAIAAGQVSASSSSFSPVGGSTAPATALAPIAQSLPANGGYSPQVFSTEDPPVCLPPAISTETIDDLSTITLGIKIGPRWADQVDGLLVTGGALSPDFSLIGASARLSIESSNAPSAAVPVASGVAEPAFGETGNQGLMSLAGLSILSLIAFSSRHRLRRLLGLDNSANAAINPGGPLRDLEEMPVRT